MDEPSPKVVRELAQFLREIDAMTLATVDAEGLPHATTLYFAADADFNFYFASDPESGHCAHIERHGPVALAGHAPIRMWQQVRGVQIWGTAHRVPEANRQQAWAIYRARYPHVDEITEQVRAMAFYCVTPRRVRWIDNSVHFGFKVELDFPLPAGAEPTAADSRANSPQK